MLLQDYKPFCFKICIKMHKNANYTMQSFQSEKCIEIKIDSV